MTSDRDTLFNTEAAPLEFSFDEDVARVFQDMIGRSVPGYATVISMIGLLAKQYCSPNSSIYDLGCSLGAACLAVHNQVPHQDYSLIGVDNSEPMVAQCRDTLAAVADSKTSIEIRCEDVLSTEISNASVVILNFTLQFIPVEHRSALIERIYQGLLPGGILILSEKIQFPDPALNNLFIDAHHAFKQRMGYSALEVSNKRSALENVLIPETIDTHKQRMRQAGFESVDLWFQCFNFSSLVALK